MGSGVLESAFTSSVIGASHMNSLNFNLFTYKIEIIFTLCNYSKD